MATLRSLLTAEAQYRTPITLIAQEGLDEVGEVAVDSERSIVLTGGALHKRTALWDYHAGLLVRQVSAPTTLDDMTEFQLSHAGDVMYVRRDNCFRIESTATGVAIRVIDIPVTHLRTVVLSPGEEEVGFLGKDRLCTVRTDGTGSPLCVAMPRDTTRSLAVDESGTHALVTATRGVFVVDLAKQLVTKLLTIRPRSLRSLQGAGGVLALNNDGKALVLSPVTGETLMTLEVDFPLARVTSHPDIPWVLCIGKRKEPKDGGATPFCVWNLRTDRHACASFGSHVSVSVTEDGAFFVLQASGSTGRGFGLFDPQTLQMDRTFGGLAATATSVTFSAAEDLIVSGHADGNVVLWDMRARERIGSIATHGFPVASVAIDPAGERLISADAFGHLLFTNLLTARREHTVEELFAVRSVSFSPSGKFYLVVGSYSLSVRSVRDDHVIAAYRSSLPIEAAGFAGDERSISIVGGDEGKYLIAVDVVSLDDSTVSYCYDTLGRLVAATVDPASGTAVVVMESSQLEAIAALWPERYQRWTEGETDAELDALSDMEDREDRVPGEQAILAVDGRLGRVHMNPAPFGLLRLHSIEGSSLIAETYDSQLVWLDITSGEIVGQQAWPSVLQYGMLLRGNRFVLGTRLSGRLELLSQEGLVELASLYWFADGTWTVVDPTGRYDAAVGDRDLTGIHWAAGLEAVTADQFADEDFTPGLLGVVTHSIPGELEPRVARRSIALAPLVEVTVIDSDRPTATVRLTNRGGGVSRVAVAVNGIEITPDALNGGRRSETITAADIDLSAGMIAPGSTNMVEVVASNGEGTMRSAPARTSWVAPGTAETRLEEFYGLIVGVGDYADPALHLPFAAGDAKDLASAVQIGATRLLLDSGARVHIRVLASGGSTRDEPSKRNVLNALEDLASVDASALVFVYLAGHGREVATKGSHYYFLTEEARSSDLTGAEPREAAGLSDKELAEVLRRIHAQHRLLILDSCGADAAGASLLARGGGTPGAAAARVVADLRKRTGVYLLMGTSRAGVSSSEASRSFEGGGLGRSLVAAAMLTAFRGGARDQSGYVDVGDLVSFVEKDVSRRARSLGVLQGPISSRVQPGAGYPLLRFLEEDLERLPTSKRLHAVGRPIFLDTATGNDQTFRLQDAVTSELLRRSNRIAPAGPTSPPAIEYVDASVVGSGWTVSGTYTVGNDIVKVKLSVSHGGKSREFPLEYRAGDVRGLAEAIVDALQTEIKGDDSRPQ